MIAPSFHELFKKFHKALNLYYEDNGPSLYDPQEMRKFADRCAPGLFNQLHDCIKNDCGSREASSERLQQQLQRTVSILHSLSFFRNQVPQASCYHNKYFLLAKSFSMLLFYLSLNYKTVVLIIMQGMKRILLKGNQGTIFKTRKKELRSTTKGIL